MGKLSIVFDGQRLEQLRALHGQSCNVLFLSNEALSVVAKLSEILLWPTKWNDGKRGKDLPEIAIDIYEELNMNACTVDALGVAIGESLTMTINVDNNQTCSGGCGCAGDGEYVVNPDGSVSGGGGIVDPPLPVEWDDNIGGMADDDRMCELAYGLWAVGGSILAILDRAGDLLGLFGALLIIAGYILPAGVIALLGGGTAMAMAWVASGLSASSELLAGVYEAKLEWETNKDDIICRLNGYGSDVDSMINGLASEIGTAYGGFVLDGFAEVKEFLLKTNVRAMILNFVYGDLLIDVGMPSGYLCCPVEPATECLAYNDTLGADDTGERVIGTAERLLFFVAASPSVIQSVKVTFELLQVNPLQSGQVYGVDLRVGGVWQEYVFGNTPTTVGVYDKTIAIEPPVNLVDVWSGDVRPFVRNDSVQGMDLVDVNQISFTEICLGELY